MTAPVQITAKVIGASELKARFAAVREQVPRFFNEETVGRFLVERMKARFMAGVGPDGERWARYKSGPRKGQYATLYQSGDLYRSIDVVDKGQRLGGSATGFGFRIGIKSRTHMDGSRSTTTLAYGRLHQQGIGITRRRFIGISKDDAALLANKIRTDLKLVVAGF